MKISDRAPLKTALEDIESTLLILRPGLAEIHDEAIEAVRPQPWRMTFLLERMTILTPAERAEWLPDGTDFVVLGGEDPKIVGPQGTKEDLRLPDGTPSRLKIRGVFAKGDQL